MRYVEGDAQDSEQAPVEAVSEKERASDDCHIIGNTRERRHIG